MGNPPVEEADQINKESSEVKEASADHLPGSSQDDENQLVQADEEKKADDQLISGVAQQVSSD